MAEKEVIKSSVPGIVVTAAIALVTVAIVGFTAFVIIHHKNDEITQLRKEVAQMRTTEAIVLKQMHTFNENQLRIAEIQDDMRKNLFFTFGGNGLAAEYDALDNYNEDLEGP